MSLEDLLIGYFIVASLSPSEVRQFADLLELPSLSPLVECVAPFAMLRG